MHADVQRGMVDESDERRAAILQADDRAVDPDVAQELVGAVDGVDDPAVIGLGPGEAELLSDDPGLGERRLDSPAKGLLGFAVGGGDGARVGLRLDLEALGHAGVNDFTGRAGQVDRGVAQLPPPRHGHLVADVTAQKCSASTAMRASAPAESVSDRDTVCGSNRRM